MTRTKAQYKGQINEGKELKPFSDELQEKLRSFHRNNGLVKEAGEFEDAFFEATDSDAADEFVARLQDIAFNISSNLLHMHEYSNPTELENEYHDLLKHLKAARDKLRTISLCLNQLIPAGAEPERVAELINQVVVYMEDTPLPTSKGTGLRPEQRKIPVAIEMVIQVLEVLNEYGFNPLGKINKSKVIELLEQIGNEMDMKPYHLIYDKQSWKKRVREAQSGESITAFKK